jgi:alpha-beta hydrolase superfamily lysophospholipase
MSHPAPGPTVTSGDGATLGTDVVGAVDRPLVLVLHGVGSSRTHLHEAVVPPLLASGWRVATADLRGHGDGSPVADPSHHGLDRQVADVAALVATLAPVALVGVSLGGHAAVAAVARGAAPGVRRVVAALPAWTGRAVPGVGPHAAVATEVRAHGVAGMLARLGVEEGLRPWLRRVLLRDLAVHDPDSLAAALVALDGGLAPTAAEIGRLGVPLGVVGWPDDPGHPLAVAEAWAAAAATGHLAELTLDDPDREPAALGARIGLLLGAPAVAA